MTISTPLPEKSVCTSCWLESWRTSTLSTSVKFACHQSRMFLDRWTFALTCGSHLSVVLNGFLDCPWPCLPAVNRNTLLRHSRWWRKAEGKDSNCNKAMQGFFFPCFLISVSLLGYFWRVLMSHFVCGTSVQEYSMLQHSMLISQKEEEYAAAPN